MAAVVVALVTGSGCTLGSRPPPAVDASDSGVSVGTDSALGTDSAPSGTDSGFLPRCVAGDYEGPFDGMVTVGGGTYMGAGIFHLRLESGVGPDGEMFVIADGIFDGVAAGFFPFSGELQGTLDCSSLTLEDGLLLNGVVDVFGDLYFFEGTIAASYVPYEHRFESGTWDGVQTGGGPPTDGTGAGTWVADLLP